MIIDPATANGTALYMMIVDCVTPRPIGWISTIDADGCTNLAPFSFFNMLCSNPPICYFSAAVSAKGKKDSHRNVEEVPEFVVNIVTEELAERMNQTAYPYEHGVSEFSAVGLTAAPSDLVRPPRVAESPFAMECKVLEVKRYGPEHGGTAMVIGEAIRIHVADEIIDANQRVDPRKIRTVGRLGGSWYCTTQSLFELARPTPANLPKP